MKESRDQLPNEVKERELKIQEFLNILESDIETKVYCFSPTDLAITAWALAKLGRQGESEAPLLEKLKGQALKCLKLFSDSDLLTISSALCQLGGPMDELLTQLESEVKNRLEDVRSVHDYEDTISDTCVDR